MARYIDHHTSPFIREPICPLIPVGNACVYYYVHTKTTPSNFRLDFNFPTSKKKDF